MVLLWDVLQDNRRNLLDDHHNGRCTMIPMVVGATNEFDGAGETWFNSLNEEEQRSIMGPGKLEAWRDGKFTLADVPVTRPDDVYGQMRNEKTLAELTGDK
jgi:hypothetical protein